MFNVGDRVRVISGFQGIPTGSVVTIESSYYGYAIEGEFCNVITDNGFRFTGLYYTRFLPYEEVSKEVSVERKIRSIYARQGRRTKLPCFC